MKDLDSLGEFNLAGQLSASVDCSCQISRSESINKF